MEKKEQPELRLFDNTEDLSLDLADYVYQLSESAIKDRGSFSIVLSGGDIPKRLGKLTKSPYLKMVEWSKWHVFWAEENVVPKRHPDSFYWQANQDFLSKVPIQPGHVVPVSHDVVGESAATRYEFSIRQLVKNRTVAVSPSSDCPKFDLILLNLGAHGHVASLYPDHCVLEEDSQWVSCVMFDSSYQSVTLTLPVINAAANVAIVASGADLAQPFMDVMVGFEPISSRPAQMVWPRDGKLVWFVEACAASLFLCEYNGDATSSQN